MKRDWFVALLTEQGPLPTHSPSLRLGVKLNILFGKHRPFRRVFRELWWRQEQVATHRKRLEGKLWSVVEHFYIFNLNCSSTSFALPVVFLWVPWLLILTVLTEQLTTHQLFLGLQASLPKRRPLVRAAWSVIQAWVWWKQATWVQQAQTEALGFRYLAQPKE